METTGKNKKITSVTREGIIEAGIKDAWQKLGPEFADAYKWASIVNHSQANNNESLNGSACSVRGCDIEGTGKTAEKLLDYSESEHMIHYEVVEGKPSMVSYLSNYWKLSPLDEGKTKLIMRMDMIPKGLMGTLMKGMMKMNMKKVASVLMEDFTYYVEKGSPHPRKAEA